MSKKRKHRFGYESNIVVHHRSVKRRAASVSLPDRWADEKRTPSGLVSDWEKIWLFGVRR